ncbi:hypothetical protein DB347_08645 [Opitutaceae bacterium EW11]|nr:hypothetical protein DB347_08645 [Opitutaceae bacterium EW11]
MGKDLRDSANEIGAAVVMPMPTIKPESRPQPLGRSFRVSIEYSCLEEPAKRVREVIQLDVTDGSVTSVTAARTDGSEPKAEPATPAHSSR